MSFTQGRGWSLVWGSNGTETATSIAVDSDSVYICGSSNSLGSLSVGSFDMFFLKIDATLGQVQSFLRMGWSGNDIANGIAVQGGNVFIVGQSSSPGWTSSKTDMVFIRIDSSEIHIDWANSLGGPGDDIAVAVVADSVDLYSIGYGDSGTLSLGSFDVIITQYSSDGTLKSVMTLGGTSPDYGVDICVFGTTILVTGHSMSSGLTSGFSDIFVAAIEKSKLT